MDDPSLEDIKKVLQFSMDFAKAKVLEYSRIFKKSKITINLERQAFGKEGRMNRTEEYMSVVYNGLE